MAHGYCELCKVGGYGLSFEQHMKGKKHAAKVRALAARASGAQGSGLSASIASKSGAASMPCFAFRNKGYCPKGSACPFSHGSLGAVAQRQPLVPAKAQPQAKSTQVAPKRKRQSYCGQCGNDGEWCHACGGGGHADAQAEAARSPENPGRAPCFEFQKSGRCAKGASCTYAHPPPGEQHQRALPCSEPPENPGRAPCFAFQNTGHCPKGASCTFAHPPAHSLSSTASAGAPASRVSPPSGGAGLSREQLATIEKNRAAALARRTTKAVQQPGPLAEVGAASAQCEFALTRPAPIPEPFPAALRGVLTRRQMVSLSISEGEVVFQSGKYDAAVITALKEYLPNRRWEPKDKSWRCPVEGLPTAIALYEHMGRKTDASVKSRAAAVSAAGGDRPSLNLDVRLDLGASSLLLGADGGAEDVSLGKVIVSFSYSHEVVAAIKCLPPWQRSWDPATKSWPVELLALPELLDALEPLCAEPPSERLHQVSLACSKLSEIIFAPQTAVDDDDQQPEVAVAPTPDTADVKGMRSSEPAAAGFKSPAGASAAATTAAVAGKQQLTFKDFFTKPTKKGGSGSKEQQLVMLDATPSPSAGVASTAAVPAAEPDSVDQASQFQSALTELLRSIHGERRAAQRATQLPTGQNLRSDCGAGPKKRRRLTDQQIHWGTGFGGRNGSSDYDDDGDDDDVYDDYDDYDDGGGSSLLAAAGLGSISLSRSWLASTLSARRPLEPPADCDCGRPEILTGGRHTCKYFGSFRCGGCTHKWTSANTWKGEQQDCQRCNKSSLPESTTPLERGRGSGGMNGPHDRSRCGMCKRLGYDCSGGGRGR